MAPPHAPQRRRRHAHLLAAAAGLACLAVALQLPTAHAQAVTRPENLPGPDRQRFTPSIDANSLRDKIPRFGGTAGFPGNNPTPAEETAYENELIYLTIPGLAMAFISFVWMISYFCGSLFCGWGRPKLEGYGAVERYGPLLLCFVLSVLNVIFCGIGYDGNAKFSDGLGTRQTKESGAIGVLTTLIVDTKQFLHDDAFPPIVAMRRQLPDWVNDVNVSLAGMPDLNALVDNPPSGGLADRLATFVTTWNAFQRSVPNPGNANAPFQASPPPAGPAADVEFPCGVCAGFAAAGANATTQMRAAVAPLAARVDAARDDIRASFVDLAPDIALQLETMLRHLNESLELVNNKTDLVNDRSDQFESYDYTRFTVYVILFIIPLASFALVVLGGITKSGVFFKLNYWIGFVILLSFWSLFALHLPAALLFADVCVWMDAQEADLDSLMGPDVAVIARGCLDRTAFTEIYNLTDDAFGFQALSKPGRIPNLYEEVPTTFAFPALQDAVQGATALTPQQVFTPSMTAAFVALSAKVEEQNAGGTAVYNRSVVAEAIGAGRTANDESVVACAPTGGACVAEVTPYMQYAFDVYTAEAQGLSDVLNVSALAMQADARALEAHRALAQEAADVATRDLARVRTADLASAESGAKSIEPLDCDFVGDGYRNFKVAFCDNMLSGLGAVVLALWMVSVTSLVITALSIVLEIRIPNEYIPDDGKKPRAERERGAGARSDDRELAMYR